MSDDKWGAGDSSKWQNWGFVKIGNSEYPLIWGEHKHSYSENKMYVLDGGKEPTEFDGHRILIDVVIRSHTYLKESELSGNEYRKGGEAQIIADGVVVYSFFFRDPQRALLKAHSLIDELSEHPSNIMTAKGREELIGRKIYYRDHPAVITRLILDQGCVIIRSSTEEPLPNPAWRDDDDEHEWEVKDEILSPHIWWFRD